MELITSNNYEKYKNNSTCLAIGAFDGLHKGHQLIIDKCMQIADQKEIPSAVLSFEPHPLTIVPGHNPPPSIVSRKQKISILEKMGIDYYFEQEFNEEFAALTAVEFVKDILLDKLKVDTVVVGSDFRFAKNNEGSVEILNELAEVYGFNTNIISQLHDNDDRISSTRIRRLLRNGKLEKAEQLLGRPYQICGKVVHGKKVGRKLGYPTANLNLESNYAIPPHGVYAVKVYFNEQIYYGAASLGHNPTFDDQKFSFEIFIIDFDKNLYEKRICVDLVEFIRPEINFSGPEELKKQMQKDVLYTRKLLC